MEKIEKFKHQIQWQKIVNELKQKQGITDNLIGKILLSKRLLIDHVEALEQCMQHQKQSMAAFEAHVENEIFSTRNAYLILSGTLLEYIIIPKELRFFLIPSAILTSSFSAIYMVKQMFKCRNKIVERSLAQLIRHIDDFSNCIRRSMTYFQEIIIMKQNECIESCQIERAWDCITTVKEVIEILYDATRNLEKSYPLPAQYSEYYAPMEELRECEYFKNNITNYSPKHIKEFHNIFAYVQSQFLLRVALTIFTKPSISQINQEIVKIDCLIHQLVQQEEQHFEHLTIELKKKQQLELTALNHNRAMQNRSGPIAVLQDSSLKLSARMIAVAAECQALDITLQRLTEQDNMLNNAQDKQDMEQNMHSIASALSVCFDDFQRLMLVYNKFLNYKQSAIAESETPSGESITDAQDDSVLRVEITPNEEQKHDDFYAYMFNEKNCDDIDEHAGQQVEAEMEILNFEKRLTKGKFKPVLKQLKDRIDPIRKMMLEKERQVLSAKGVDVDELFNKTLETEHELSSRKISCNDDEHDADDEENSGNSDSGSMDSIDLKQKARINKFKERDNYAEMRNFLAQKEAINIFKLEAPKTKATEMVHIAGTEDLLESEC